MLNRDMHFKLCLKLIMVNVVECCLWLNEAKYDILPSLKVETFTALLVYSINSLDKDV